MDSPEHYQSLTVRERLRGKVGYCLGLLYLILASVQAVPLRSSVHTYSVAPAHRRH
ncbi:hypothetical protein DL93DRAFT_2081350 [Clavulina sp. PMI_390]|nr:hypothetical protein DL93DRAFT_2081350 [Clavulina sp. PMI_390]